MYAVFIYRSNKSSKIKIVALAPHGWQFYWLLLDSDLAKLGKLLTGVGKSQCETN